MAFESVFPADRDQRWRDRVKEIPKLLEYIYGKEADKRDQRVEFVLRSTNRGADRQADVSEPLSGQP